MIAPVIQEWAMVVLLFTPWGELEVKHYGPYTSEAQCVTILKRATNQFTVPLPGALKSTCVEVEQ